MNADPIEIKDLSMRYRRGGPDALSDLNLTVGRGQIFGYLGPNGAGKTTTLKILVGLLRHTSGTVRIFGRDPSECEARQHVGFLPEDPRFYEYLTAAETMRFFGRLYGMEHRLIKSRTGKCLDLVDLGYATDVRVGNFSRGMRQRLGLAQALLSDPDLLLLDEPLSGLDPAGRAGIRDVILSQAAAGKTVLFSSHVLPDVEAICSTVAMVRKGKLLETGSMGEILSGSLKTIEMVVSGLQPHSADAVGKLASGIMSLRDKQVVTATDLQSAQEIMKLIISHKGVVESITPRRETLEDYFMRRMREGKE